MATSALQTAPRSAWLLLAFLTLINVVNFVDRQLITSLQIPLRDDPDLHLTDVQNQLLAGYAFSAVYSLAGLALGTLADRRHRPRLIALGLLVWSAMTAASGLAYNFWQLGLARIFVAVGEATLTPAAIAMLCDVFPPKRRALATGLYYLGIPLGASLSLIIANLLWPIPWVGWRGCFFILGLIGLMLVAVLLVIRDPQRGGTEAPTDTPPQPATSVAPANRLIEMFQALAGSPALVLTMLGGIVINIGVGTTWLEASWLNAERGFTKQGAPIFLGVALLLGGSAGNFIGGWLGDRMQHRWRGGRLLALIVLQCALTPFAVAFRFLPGDLRVPLFVCCVFTSMLVTFMYGPVLATIQELTPLRLRATMIAFLLIGLNILGASLGSVLAAWLAGRLGSYTWGIFITAQASLLAMPLFWAARHFQLKQRMLTT
ncbi:MAG TPA: MFS transporter [Gemmataceae bacterium]|nr:MFS transporter [Gemmataceae bacterium]